MRIASFAACFVLVLGCDGGTKDAPCPPCRCAEPRATDAASKPAGGARRGGRGADGDDGLDHG